jgi:hypothetical protein
MTSLVRSVPVLCLLTVVEAACFDPPAVLERRFERTFQVAAGSSVRVELSGGSVTTQTGPAGTVRLQLRQVARTTGGERRAEDMLSNYQVSAIQKTGTTGGTTASS